VIAPNAFIHLEGGTITVEAGDDGIDSNGTIAVTGGETVVSAAYDGIDANGSFTITGGSVVVNGAPVNDNFQDGLEVLGGLIFSGGTLLSAAIAASYTPPAPASAQGWISIKLGASQPAGTIVQLAAHPTEPSADATVTVLAAYQAGKAFRSMLFTSSAITNGQTYDVYTGGSVSGRNIGGLYAAGDLTGATKVATVEAGRFTR
ncbi:MAG: carbohydrate-binding domain-containing protein, partial [Micromonosporaceae bacterium]|nr:carbohydrate-binding domain-containing protein [Micromonosporaceae bacterium]